MSDREIIQKAYRKLVAQAFNVYWQAIISGSPEREAKEADERFIRGVTLAAKARDDAIALLPK
jgi:hypothetical protein